MDNNKITAEQKLKDAAEEIASKWFKHVNSEEDWYIMKTEQPENHRAIIEMMVEISKSEAAREYWSQSQSSEIERLRQELDFAQKDRDSLKAKWEANSCTIADLADESDQLKKFGETLKAEISSLKSQLEAKAVDVEAIKKEFEDTICHVNEEYWGQLVVETYAKVVWDFFAKHLQTGKSEAVEWNSENIIGRVRERHKELRAKGWDYQAFYNGWLEGRVDMLRINKGV